MLAKVPTVHDRPARRGPYRCRLLRGPQFVPQIRKLTATHETSGLSWSWAMLTAINNAAWMGYFTLSQYWSALVPSCSASLLAGTLALLLARRGQASRRSIALVSAWAAMLGGAYGIAGRSGLGAVLTAAFIIQVTPSIWVAYRTAVPAGISAGTWLLVLGELSCWLAFGLHKSDPRLMILGACGITASGLMLARSRPLGASAPSEGLQHLRATYRAEEN